MEGTVRVALVAALLTAVTGIGEAAGPCPSSGMQTRYDYKEALCMSILFYEAERSGPLPDDMRFPWRGDSALGDGSDVGLDLTGGYYDAGDHVKFNFPMAGSITNIAWGLLSFREGFEAAGQVGYAEDAIRWGTDYFLSSHTEETTLYAQVGDGDVDHTFWGRPEEMTMNRPSMKVDAQAPGSDMAGETAAALAAASLVFQDSDPDYSAELLVSARQLFDFADQYRELYQNSLSRNGTYYASSSYGDELTWSSLWLYKATGEQEYADKAVQFWDEFNIGQIPARFNYDSKIGGAQVLYAELFGEELYTDTVQRFMEDIRGNPHTPGGLVYLDIWGSLRHAMNAALIAFKAAQLGIDPEINQVWAAQQADYVLGSSGRSYMVGFGVNPPQRPHHRGSSCPDLPEPCDDGWALNQDGPNPHVLYGAIVGGPDQNDGYTDDRNDYVHNEVACDYNAAVPGVMAAMVMIN